MVGIANKYAFRILHLSLLDINITWIIIIIDQKRSKVLHKTKIMLFCVEHAVIYCLTKNHRFWHLLHFGCGANRSKDKNIHMFTSNRLFLTLCMTKVPLCIKDIIFFYKALLNYSLTNTYFGDEAGFWGQKDTFWGIICVNMCKPTSMFNIFTM